MQVAFYFDNSRLGNWRWADFLSGAVPMSGTDGQFLHLLARMARRAGVTVAGYFKGGLPALSPDYFEPVNGVSDAPGRARATGAEIFLLNNFNEPREMASAIRACQAAGLPMIVWDQNGPYPELVDMLAQAEIVRRVVCVSKSQADGFRHHRLFRKVAVIYNALLSWENAAQTEPSDRCENICFLGATVAEKGLHHVARAWPEIKSARPDATLTIIGSNRLYDRHCAVGPLGLAQRDFEEKFIGPFLGHDSENARHRGVVIKGLMAPAAIRRLLREQQVVIVNPSVSRGGSFETFCVSAIEAQAEGCAVIGGRRLGLRETVIDGVTGSLIRHESRLAPALIELLREPEKARAMGRQAAAWVKNHFSVDQADSQWTASFTGVKVGTPILPLPFSVQRATPKDYARLLFSSFRLGTYL